MLLKISSWLSYVSFILKQKSIYYELMYYIKNNKTYLKLVGEQDRCTGKTHSLILLALKFNCPIVVSNMHNKRHVEDLARSLSNKSVKIIVVNDELIAKRQAILLCDEGINREIINNILKPMIGLGGGYLYLYGFHFPFS